LNNRRFSALYVQTLRVKCVNNIFRGSTEADMAVSKIKQFGVTDTVTT
jgi:hypothetical protein